MKTNKTIKVSLFASSANDPNGHIAIDGQEQC